MSPLLGAAAPFLFVVFQAPATEKPPEPGPAKPQFRFVKDAFGTETFWTEGVGFGDIDNDGDIDVLFARGEGWDRPGRRHQNALFLNALDKGPMTFEDVSVARLGNEESNARDVLTADVDADGFLDLLYCNGFNRAPPYLYINRGAKKPGFFSMQSDERGLTEALSSASADFGDIDNDGDLDLLIADTGPKWADFPGGKPRLYLNDGKGFFKESTHEQFPATVKTTHQGINLCDLDGDFDLDFFGPNKAEDRGLGHYLMWNDGKGNFTDGSDALPVTSGEVYEADDADLDGDGDEDLFFISLAKVDGPDRNFPFGEGPAKNLLKETGHAKFESGAAITQDDDNDLVFLDYDQDGDLDVVVGSLGPREKLLKNSGDLKFELADGVIEAVKDPTLDIGVADLDNDGDYDLVTANGLERIGAKQPPCGLYVNEGPKDHLAPRIQAIESLPDPSPAAGPFVLRVRARDDSLDDGRTWLTLRCLFAFGTDADATLEPSQEGEARFMGGSQWRCVIKDAAPANATRLGIRIVARDTAGNESRSDVKVVKLTR